MAISYTLDIATPLPVAQVASELHRVALDAGLLLASTSEAQILDSGVVTASGTWLRMVAPTLQPRDPVITGLGFRPTVSMVFRFDKFVDPDLQASNMVQLVSGLLDHVPGDLVLHYQYETIWLLRLGDDLSISDRDDLWPPDRLALLTRSYHRGSLAFTG